MRTLLFFYSFWISRGHMCRPFFPPGSRLKFLSRTGFSNPTARRFVIECYVCPRGQSIPWDELKTTGCTK